MEWFLGGWRTGTSKKVTEKNLLEIKKEVIIVRFKWTNIWIKSVKKDTRQRSEIYFCGFGYC